jgi:hypothetical protein
MGIGKYKLLQQICIDYELDIGELMDRYNVSKPAKRNRKRQMIEMEEYSFNGNVYLVDSKNNAFKYDPVDSDTVLLVGKRTFSGTIELLDFDADN